MGSSAEWAIPPENVKKYENLFESMERAGDKVSGEVMSKVRSSSFLWGSAIRLLCFRWSTYSLYHFSVLFIFLFESLGKICT